MTRFLYTLATECSLVAGSALAQQVPAGWQLIKDTKKLCQIAVPADWTTDEIMQSRAKSPDGKSTVTVHALPPGTSFENTVAAARKIYKPEKDIEASPSRTWFAHPPDHEKPAVTWYVATPGAQVCDAQVEFADAAMETTARKIVHSLGPSK